MDSGFTKASELPIGTSNRIDDLEQLLTRQDARIAELEAENDALRIGETARPKRLSSEALKDSERLMLLARINDLTIANQALENDLRQSVKTAEENIEILFTLVAKLKAENTPQPMQQDRGEILTALLEVNGGKLPAIEARRTMHMSKQAFSNLLNTIPTIESRIMKTDKRRRLLVLK